MAALQPFVENITPLIVFSSVMVGLIALALPMLYLYERGSNAKKIKLVKTIAPSGSNTSNERDGINSTGNSNYELVPHADECIQCDPCELYGAMSKSPVKSQAAVHGYNSSSGSDVKTITKASGVKTFMESETGLDTSASEATEYDSIKRKLETYVPKTRTPPRPEEGTQTSVYEFDVARDCITTPDAIASEHPMGRAFVADTFTPEEKRLIAAVNEDKSKNQRFVRYERSVSNNRIITARNCPCQPSNSCNQCRKKCCESRSRNNFDDESKSRFS